MFKTNPVDVVLPMAFMASSQSRSEVIRSPQLLILKAWRLVSCGISEREERETKLWQSLTESELKEGNCRTVVLRDVSS